jgi:hypothetical protein
MTSSERTAPPNDHTGNVLELLVTSYPALFTVDEVRNELGIGNDADDALSWLVRMRLAHKMKRFYWATRTAVAMDDVAI